MPVFEYKCRSCGAEFEALVRDEALPACEKCGSDDPEKQLSVFAVSSSSGSPECASGCGGFDMGGCGSGLCPGSIRR